MATQYSQLSQSDRSRANLETSKRRCMVATGLSRESFGPFPAMDQVQEIVMKATENLIGRHDPVEVDFTPLSYYQAKIVLGKIDGITIAGHVVADAAPAPKKEGKFCVEIEQNGGWVRAENVGTSDRARDLENLAKNQAHCYPGRKVRVVPSAGGRAVLRFRSKDGVLGSY